MCLRLHVIENNIKKSELLSGSLRKLRMFVLGGFMFILSGCMYVYVRAAAIIMQLLLEKEKKSLIVLPHESPYEVCVCG